MDRPNLWEELNINNHNKHFLKRLKAKVNHHAKLVFYNKNNNVELREKFTVQKRPQYNR
jgi:hypothetical protein